MQRVHSCSGRDRSGLAQGRIATWGPEHETRALRIRSRKSPFARGPPAKSRLPHHFRADLGASSIRRAVRARKRRAGIDGCGLALKSAADRQPIAESRSPRREQWAPFDVQCGEPALGMVTPGFLPRVFASGASASAERQLPWILQVTAFARVVRAHACAEADMHACCSTMNRNALFVAAIFGSFFAVACASGADSSAPSQDDVGTSHDALRATTTVGGGLGTVVLPPPPFAVLPPPPFPPQNATYCPSVLPECSLEEWGYSEQDQLNELAGLGCSPPLHWIAGTNSGLLGGIITLCNDSPAVQQHFGNLNPPALICSRCLPQAPAGQVYKIIEAFVGPNCQSGCVHTVSHLPPGTSK